MADRIELGRGQFIFENKFEISGKEELVKFIDTLNSMTRKNNFAAYWKSQEELIRGVTKACEDFNKTQSNTDAKNLINSFNALKATADKDMDSLFSDYERIVSLFENAAKQMGSAVIGELSPANFRKAFESFEMLEAHGLETSEVFKRISSSADVDHLRKQVEDLTESLARTTRTLESVKRERDNLLNGAEMDRLLSIEEQYNDLIHRMKGEFSSFLQANDLDPNEVWGRFSRYFDQISNGSMTAKEAITAVRDEYAALIQYGEAGSTAFSSGQMQEFISKLENACTMIEQMRGEIQALTEGAALRQMTEEMAASEAITERQREAISSLVAEGSGLSSVAQLLVELIKNFDATEHETNEAATAVKGLLDTLKAIGDYGNERLGNLSKVFENLRYATQLNVDEKQYSNLVRSLKDIGDIPNLSSLQALTNISLSGFSDMHVSKASLSNLATYLPEIAKVNVDRLKELSAVNLSNFNNLSVKKATTDNLERLFNALAGKQDATATAETAAVGKEKAALGDVNELYKAHKAAVEAAVKAEAAKTETSNKLSGSLDREKKSTDDATKEAEKHTVALTKLRSLLDQVNAARAKTPGGFRNEADVESYSKLITSIHEVIEADEQQKWSAKDLEEEYKNLNLEYKEIHNAADERIRDAQRTADAARAEADAIKSEEDATRALARAGRELEDLKAKVGNLGLEENKQKMAELVSEAENLKTALETGGPENWSKNYKAFSDKLAEATHTVKQLSDEEKKADQERRKHSSTYEQINKLLQKSSDLELKYAHASGQDRDAIRNVTAELKTLREGFANGTVSQDQAAQSLERLKQTLSGVETNLRTSGTALQRWWTNGLTQLSSRLSYTFGMAAIVTKTVSEVRKMISTAVELDTAMNNLQIVTRGSNDDMAAYGKTVSQMAKETAQSTKDLIDATTVYARLGYTMDESATLSKYTAMLQGVGDIEASAAQDAMTAIIKAFHKDVDDVESVMDKLVTVGNNFPISVSQLAEGMNNAGSMLESSGNSLEQSIALLTSANTTVQNISKASTGLRTIAARIRKNFDELDELGESLDNDKYKEMVDILQGKGMNLTNANGQFRSTYEILKDIASVWGELTSMQQNTITEVIAGTRQQNVFASVITQFGEAERAMEAMDNSAGALSESYGIYMDSIQAHTNIMKAAFEELSVSFMNSDFAKEGIDFLTSVLEILTALVKPLSDIVGFLGLLGTALTAGGFIALFKNLGQPLRAA